jgi:hypothetical protein
LFYRSNSERKEHFRIVEEVCRQRSLAIKAA